MKAQSKNAMFIAFALASLLDLGMAAKPHAVRYAIGKINKDAANRSNLTKEYPEAPAEQQKDSLEAQPKVPSDEPPERSQADVIEEGGDVEVTVDGEVFKESSEAMMRSSPFFSRMLQSGMKEGISKKIPLTGMSKDDYAIFRRFLQPRAINGESITMEIVDDMIPWFDMYGMSHMLNECETLLLTQNATMFRLKQAEKYNLEAQKERCLKEVAADFTRMNVSDLPEDMETMRTLLGAIQKAQVSADQTRLHESRIFKAKVREEVQATASAAYGMLPGGCDRQARDMIHSIIPKLGI